MGIKLEDLAHLCLIFSWEYQGSCNRLSGKLHCPLGAGLRVSACFPLIKCGPKPVSKQLSLLKGISSSREFCVKYTAIKIELRSHQPCLYQRSYNWMSMGWLRVRHDWLTSLSLFIFMHWRRKWQPTPVFLPGESQGWRSLVGWRTRLKRLSNSSSSSKGVSKEFGDVSVR